MPTVGFEPTSPGEDDPLQEGCVYRFHHVGTEVKGLCPPDGWSWNLLPSGPTLGQTRHASRLVMA